ncbi:MAG: ABC transporter substrate-binding protein [Acidobacteriota bacterium]
MKKSYYLFGALCLVAVVWLYVAVRNNDASEDRSVKIGAALGLTGECANYGEGELKAIKLAVAEANKDGGIKGRPIELVVEDTECDAKSSVTAMKKLIEVDKVEAVIGPTWGDSFQAGFTVSNSRKVVTISPSTALEALVYNEMPTDYVFSTWFPEKIEVDTLQAHAQKIGAKNFVIIHDTDTYGAMLADLFARYAPQHEITIVKEFTLPVGTEDFRTTLVQAKSLAVDGIALFFQAPSSKAKVLKQMRELGLKTQVVTDASIEDMSLLANFGFAMEGLLYTYPELTGAVDEFSRKFKEEYGTDSIGASDANAYDATRATITALDERYTKDVELVDAVRYVNIPGTAVSRVLFDDAHQITEAKFVVKTVRDGEFIVVE